MGKFLAAVDWRNKNFICRFAQPTDELNDLDTRWGLDPLDISEWELEATVGSVTTEIFNSDAATGLGAVRTLGNHYYRVVSDNVDDEGIYLFKSGATYQITTVSGRYYRAVLWVRNDAENSSYATLGYRVQLISHSNTIIQTEVTGTATGTVWTQVTLQYQALASNNLTLQVVKTDDQKMIFFVAGVMIHESTSSMSAPAGYNTGQTIDLYDNITTDIRAMNWQLGFAKPYQNMMDEATAQLSLDNSTGKYSPENSASPLYGYMRPTASFEIAHYLGQAHANYRYMFTGQLSTPPLKIPFGGGGTSVGRLEAQLAAVSNKIWLDNQAFEIPIQDNANIGSVVKLILGYTAFAPYVDGVGTNAAGTVSNYTPQPTATAWDAITELVTLEQGKFYIERGGTVNFINRYYGYTSGTSMYNWGNPEGTATANSGTISQSGSTKPIRWDYSYGSNYTNLVRITARPRQTGSNGTVWQMDSQDYTIRAGKTRRWVVRLRDSIGRYTSVTSVSKSLETYSAGTATITVTANGGKATLEMVNSGTVSAILTALALTGTPKTQANEITYELGNSGTATYGLRTQNLDLTAAGSVVQVESMAEHILNRDGEFAGFVYSTTFANKGDGTANLHQLNWDIGSRLRVDIDNLYHDKDYWVIGERHSIKYDGEKYHETTFMLEPVATQSYWLAGIEGYSNAGISTRGGY